MRVLFTPFPASTHVHTQVPLAWAMRAAGHEVRVATQPDVVEDINNAGLTAVAVGEVLDVPATMNPEYTDEPEEIRDEAWLDVLDISETRPEKLTHSHVHGVLTAWTSFVYQNTLPDGTTEELIDFARAWRPDLVVWDTMYYPGALAARISGAAHARLMFGLDLVGLMRGHYLGGLAELPPALREDPLEEWMSRILRRHGREFTEDLVVGQWTIDPVPPSLRLPVDLPSVPMRYVPYNGEATIPGWLRERPRRPRVCLTLGRSFREVVGADRASAGDLLDAVADLDVEVVATFTADQLDPGRRVPGNVRVVDFVPLDALLSTSAAIVHHGGSGTLQTALAHGVPQVVVPARMWCNVPKAHRVRDAGAGLCIDPEDLTPHGLRTALVRVLEEPAFATNADRLRREVAGTPTPADIVPVLERLTAEHRAL
ncbi:activator-dependent family glycosyltransferase [Streptomyces sp. WMMC940]|uniref:activator-dependent family glycosyltransferase n=1 Tax=Streptomyces sp. WMMC940 TaxID=3015153 RepID=UPI0022B6CD81|nr:activator-dependent family glycosyltransferase [Streptomyces sp. WMMC940]MCZ7457450.1 activator-dependent family glycosyltransferase [Streptomyces sp. WMMC940]